MKEIRLMTLTLDHFKCHKHLQLDFGGGSAAVLGDNGVGKTTLSQSLQWLLFGRDGGAAQEVRPLGPDGKLRDPQAITQVEAVLQVDGENRTFRRCCHRAGNQEGTTNEYYADGVPCRRGAYLEKVNALVPEEVFRLLTDLNRFSRDLTAQRRREILFGLTGVCSDRELLESQARFSPLLEAMGKLTLEDLEKKLTLSLKDCSRAATDLPPRISELETLLLGSEARDYPGLRRQREILCLRLKAMDRPDPAPERQALTLALQELESKNTAYVREKQNRLTLVEERISLTREKLGCLRSPDALKGERQALEEKRRGLEKKEFAVFTCPTCGQTLPPEAVNRARAGFQREKQEEILNCLQREKDLLEQEQEAQARRSALLLALEELQDQAAVQRGEAAQTLPGYEAQREKLQQALSELTLPGQQENRRQELQREISDLDRLLGREAMEESARTRLQSLRQELQKAEDQENRIRRLLDLLKDFRRYQAEFLEQTVNSRFRLARFRLFRETLDGGLEERCDVTYRGIPYGGLNTGARIRVGLDIVETLRQYYGVSVPLFLDNAESVTGLKPQGGQVIRLQVVKDQELTVKKEEW